MNFFFGFAVFLVLTGGCSGAHGHFVTDKGVRTMIREDFELKRASFPQGNLFDVFGEKLSTEEREALEFLYAYMPIGDVADYEGEFFLRNVRMAFRARAELPWGREIPEDIFRHFVLPVRVNNEDLDDIRSVCYEELKERVAGLGLREAILEVNHWCHEKVVYAPSDARTSAPLASVKSAFGRCGEESVFTVAALRAVGIPARQVYTPRWAHTDDNHAWVEAWADGQWFFMGACEPEPVLNMAWFNAPARRGMLMHSRVFGRYGGPEEVIEMTDCFAEINVTERYAPVAKVRVTVTDGDGQPADGAVVEFKLYNYAEFFTVARRVTDLKGQTSLSAGKGDMLVWASRNGRFGFGKASFGRDETLAIVLDREPGDVVELEEDFVPPPDGAIPADATDAQRRENARRLEEEDRLRNRYVSTFFQADRDPSPAGELRLDEGAVRRILAAARGNRQEMEDFLRRTPEADRSLALALLETVSEKDLRDMPASVPEDHLLHTPGDRLSDAFVPFVLNPRIADELLSPYKSFLGNVLPQELKDRAPVNPQALADWIHAVVITDNGLNPQRIPVRPAGVWKARVADVHSRDIFFVAAARSLGVPARIEPVAGKVQYLSEGQWKDARFGSPPEEEAGQGTVSASYFADPLLRDPRYYSHFTIARIQPDGTLRTLDFESDEQVDMGGGVTWSRLLREPLPLDGGDYVLVTGTRMAGGNVRARMTSFRIVPGENVETELVMLENRDDIRVVGQIDAEATFRTAGSEGRTASILQTTGRGYFVIGVLGAGDEPTNHALRDIADFAPDFEAWGRSLILLFPGEAALERFRPEEFGALPSTVTFGVDADGRVAGMLASVMPAEGAGLRLPFFVVADTFGRVVFASQGYTVGLGERMLHIIRRL
jgi:transglutaminase-like putative cysteine protease